MIKRPLKTAEGVRVHDLFSNIDPLYVLSGILVGGLVGFTGVGGGSLMTPLLILRVRCASRERGRHRSALCRGDEDRPAPPSMAGTRPSTGKSSAQLALGSVPMTILTVFALYYIGVDSKTAQGIITKTLGVALLATAILLFLRKP